MKKSTDLEVYISNYSNTLPIMDRFEEYENGQKKYHRLIVKNSEVVTIDNKNYEYNLNP